MKTGNSVWRIRAARFGLAAAVLLGTAGNAAAQVIEETDRAALVALYHATNGPHWDHSVGWLTNQPLYTWHGVNVDGAGKVTGRVSYLGLFNNNLSGPIPAELGRLANLTELYLYDNQLSGPIPAELGRLANLTSLGLFNNNLSGPIPAELGRLANLTSLILHLNQLSGPIPAELGRLANLTQLGLDWNTGLCLPADFPESVFARLARSQGVPACIGDPDPEPGPPVPTGTVTLELIEVTSTTIKARQAWNNPSCETGGPGGITSTLSYIQKAGGEPVLGPWANGLMEIIVWEGLEPGASYTVWSAFEAQSVHGQCEIESNRITVTTKPLSNPDPDPDPEPEPEPPVAQTQQECLSDAGVRVGGPSNPAWDPRVGKCMPADEVDKADLKKLAKGCQDCMELHGGRGFSLENTAMAALSPRAKRNLEICLLAVIFVAFGLNLGTMSVTLVIVGAGVIRVALFFENVIGPVAERLWEKVKKASGEFLGNRLSADNGGVGNFTVKVQSTNPDALAFSFADNGDLVFNYGAAEPAAFVWTLLEDGEPVGSIVVPYTPGPVTQPTPDPDPDPDDSDPDDSDPDDSDPDDSDPDDSDPDPTSDPDPDDPTPTPALPTAFAWALGLALSAMGARRLRR